MTHGNPGLAPGAQFFRRFAARAFGLATSSTRECRPCPSGCQIAVDVPAAPMFSLQPWNCVRIRLPAPGSLRAMMCPITLPERKRFCRFCADSPVAAQVVSNMPGVEGGPWSARAVVHPAPLYRIEGEPTRRGDGIYDRMSLGGCARSAGGESPARPAVVERERRGD